MSANRLERTMTALCARGGRGVRGEAPDAPGRGDKALDPVAVPHGERGR